MAANIPFIQANLSPLSFTDVPRDVYSPAMLGVYELNRIELLRDVFTWAYERSATRYAAVRQSPGEPDPFRLKYREPLRAVVREVVRGGTERKTATRTSLNGRPQMWKRVIAKDFEVAETELLGLHEGNLARYAITPGEFGAWQKVWGPQAWPFASAIFARHVRQRPGHNEGPTPIARIQPRPWSTLTATPAKPAVFSAAACWSGVRYVAWSSSRITGR
jgi:hypothetical protein